MGFDVGGMAIGLQFLCEPFLCLLLSSKPFPLLLSFSALLHASDVCLQFIREHHRPAVANTSFRYTIPVTGWLRRLEDNTSSMMIRNEG
ncbi:hypothetical protein CGRA01v4_03475 [Colletotrichum graminicola]|nr:hypothetical protein CGRA01v4_03475 [Colletotrichum graminicola]